MGWTRRWRWEKKQHAIDPIKRKPCLAWCLTFSFEIVFSVRLYAVIEHFSIKLLECLAAVYLVQWNLKMIFFVSRDWVHKSGFQTKMKHITEIFAIFENFGVKIESFFIQFCSGFSWLWMSANFETIFFWKIAIILNLYFKIKLTLGDLCPKIDILESKSNSSHKGTIVMILIKPAYLDCVF